MIKILITGCSGLVGTHLVKKCLLSMSKYDVVGVDMKYSDNLPTSDKFTFYEMDLTIEDNIKNLFFYEKPDVVFNCFGIKGSPLKAKNNPVDFLYPSFKINTEIINQCAKNNIYLCFVSSVGVYAAAEKFIEDSVWETLPGQSDWFPSWSKRMGELLLEAYKVQYNYTKWSIIRPANIFGEYDDFSGNGTVIASTIKKVLEAKNNSSIEAWGDGSPIRDFVYAGDVADAILQLYQNDMHITINFGAGEEISIKRMIESIIKISGKSLDITWNTSKPNGDMRRQMDITCQKANGLLPTFGFENALKETYDYYVNTLELPLQITLEHLQKVGFYWGKTDNLFLNIVEHNEMLTYIKSIPITEDNYKYILDIQKNNQTDYQYNEYSIELTKISEIQKYIDDNNKHVIQRWYIMKPDLDTTDLIRNYFRKQIEKFIPNIYTDLKNNITHVDSLTFYKDGDFIENHVDGENIGRRCVILIYLSDETDYETDHENDGGGQLIINTNDEEIYINSIKENFVILDFTKNNLHHAVSPVKNGFKRYTYVDFIYNKKEYDYFMSTDNIKTNKLL